MEEETEAQIDQARCLGLHNKSGCSFFLPLLWNFSNFSTIDYLGEYPSLFCQLLECPDDVLVNFFAPVSHHTMEVPYMWTKRLINILAIIVFGSFF